MEATLNTLAHSTIDGRNVWLYQIESPIGNIHIVDYEQRDMSIKRTMFEEQLNRAEKKYSETVKKIAGGRL